jgi:hypothetical protein
MPRRVEAYEDPITGTVYKTAQEAAAAENKLSRKKLAELKRRIKAGKFWLPQVGEYIYTRTSISCDHGETDVAGGLSTVVKVYFGMSGGDPKTPFVEIAQHDRGGWNWRILQEEQKELMKRHGNKFAYPDPDPRDFYDPHEWQ